MILGIALNAGRERKLRGFYFGHVRMDRRRSAKAEEFQKEGQYCVGQHARLDKKEYPEAAKPGGLSDR